MMDALLLSTPAQLALLAEAKAQLSPSQRQALAVLVAQQQKSPAVAKGLCLLLGLFGAHRFYLGQPDRGVLYLLSSVTLVSLLVALLDLVFLGQEVERLNRHIELSLLNSL